MLALPQMETFTRLTVIRKPHPTHWICRCECGEVKMFKVWNLVHGYVKSCGCLRRDRAKAWCELSPVEMRGKKICLLCGNKAGQGYRKLKGGGVVCQECTHTARGRRFVRKQENAKREKKRGGVNGRHN